MSLLIALLLAQSTNITVNSAVFRDTDGGWTVRTTTGGSTGGPSSNVTVTNFPATQPVSIASMPSTPVTGTFWQATQPVSGTVNVSNFDGGVNVNNWPASQAVTGTVAVSNFPASQAVTGTFWQATQPVSIAGTVNVVATNYDAGVWIVSAPAPTARAVAYGSSPTAVVAGNLGQTIEDLEGRPYVNTAHPRAITCNLSTTATTSTQVTGCELVASNSIYITSITVGGGVATGATAPAIIQSGTSTACTGPVVLYRCGHVAQDTCTISFPTPIKATAGHGICLLDATVGTKWVTITGYVAP